MADLREGGSLTVVGLLELVGWNVAADNALAESLIGLFRTELIKPAGPWRTVEQVEMATLEYVTGSTTAAVPGQMRRAQDAAGVVGNPVP